jgi:hypothetical protein
MTDLYPGLALGDALNPQDAIIIPAKAESAITKGQLVIWNTHTAGEIGSVSVAGAGAKNVAGVALKTLAAGEVGPILIRGIVKVTASGAISLGSKIASGTAGVVVASAALDAPVTYAEADMQTELDKIEARCGMALQTFANADTGLVFIDAVR